jgi:hypothetical protein
MAAWGAVAHDIASTNMQGKAVVSISMVSNQSLGYLECRVNVVAQCLKAE